MSAVRSTVPASSRSAPSGTPRVVVVGAGFAGLSAAKHLSGHGMHVTVVDRNNFHTFQPLLYEVATAGLEASDVAYPVRAILRRRRDVTFRHSSVESVDPDRRRIELSDGSVLEYDELVVATGATAGFFGIEGAAEHAHPLYTLRDARRMRNLVLECLEDAESHPESHDGGAPTFVVVGGGATGVEMSGALCELLEIVKKRDHVAIDWERTRVILVDVADRLLTAFKDPAGSYALDTLVKRGVDVRLGTSVERVTPRGLVLGGEHDGDEIGADLVIWAAGVTVEGTLAAGLPAKKEKGGRVEVLPDLSVEGYPNIHVVGDAAAVPLSPEGGVSPQLAQVAIQSGRHAAEAIARRRSGGDTVPFRYRDKGQMATIGRRAAVAQLTFGPTIRGVLGWVAWLGLHLVYLIGFRNRVVVLINWTWRYFYWPSGPRLIIADESDTGPVARR